MKIGVFSTHILWNTHYETELEVIQKHLNNNDKVYHITCSTELSHCELIFWASKKENKNYDSLKNAYCEWCIKRKKIGWKLLDGKIKKVKLMENNNNKIELPNPLYFQNHDSIKKLTYENYDIGWSLLSSLISLTQDPHADLSKYQSELFNNYMDCIRIYNETKDKISKLKLDRIYSFNGRLSYTKAIFRAARQMGVDCYILERGSAFHKYGCFVNHLPHDIEMFKVNANKLWEEEIDLGKKKAIADDFFQKRRKGIIGSWHSMIELQREGVMPDNWNTDKVNITFYTSSDDEFASVDETWNNPYFKDQFQTLEYLQKLLNEDAFSKYHLYVRVHPNSKRLGEDYVNKFFNFNSNNITIIHPESSISTYALMDNSNIILTSGSTIGYESVYAKRYTIQLGKSLYHGLKGPINPEDVNEIRSLLLNHSVPLEVPLDVIKLGYYMNSHGIPYKYYSPINHMTGSFKGVDICKESFKKKLTLKNRIKVKIKTLLIKFKVIR